MNDNVLCSMDQVSDLQAALPTTVHPGYHIDICLNPVSTARPSVVKDHVLALLHKNKYAFGDFIVTEFEEPFLQDHVISVSLSDSEPSGQDRTTIDLRAAKLHLHVFQLHEDGPGSEELDGEELAAANHWLLPSSDFHGIWENLVFDEDIKGQLLHFATTTLLFSDKNVDKNVISWNRVVLLHGPPGTGKTSLCKALAQKLCIRLSDRYTYGQLIEINSHSLFSKWFSESGKLVMKMFQKIQEMIDDPEALVCVLIDEIESLTAARKSTLSGNEPSDAIRVVNALLTQLDQIKRYPNVMILTTSNVTGAIDLAFVDRADIKQYIGLPLPKAIFKIYHSCINELMRSGIIMPAQQLLDLRALEVMSFAENEATKLSLQLRDVSKRSYGLSGRALRKLPFIAHALFVQKSTVTLEDFLVALDKASQRQFKERADLTKD
ncbi:hypothetical protein ScPMuIL_000006 [Solemya velum]